MRASRIGRAQGLFIGGVLLCCVAVFVAYAFVENRRALEETRAVDDQSPLAVTGVDGDDHILYGNRTAPVQMIVYSDLDCPYCKHLYRTTLPGLEKQFGASIVVVFRHLPLPKHAAAYPEAIAAECVFSLGGESGFNAFISTIYNSPLIDGPVDPATLTRVAVAGGVEKAAFETCVNTEATAARVKRDVVQGAIAGLDVTPSIVLKSSGRSMIIKGDYPSQISTGISYLLAKK